MLQASSRPDPTAWGFLFAVQRTVTGRGRRPLRRVTMARRWTCF